MPNARFTGLNLSARTLAILLAVVGVAGAMAFYRAHTTPAAMWLGLTTSNQAPLGADQVPNLLGLDREQEMLAEHVDPAVVTVNVTAHTTPGEEGGPGGEGGGEGGGPGGGGGQGMPSLPPDNPLSQFFGQFGGGGQMQRRPQFEQGVGSGIIISPDGYIVTNNHVVEGATDIRVTLTDNRMFDGKVVGTDVLTDLAVVKIAATGLPNLPWGDSKALKQGDNVFAFGDPFEFNGTMTHGIVSAKGRIAGDRTDARAPGDYIQTDAAINPGNSGGPLVNSRGEVVGVNAFIYTSTGSFSGEAFAIPSEIAQPISATLIAKGKVVRGYLGITIIAVEPNEAHFFNLPADAQGALVSSIAAGGSPGAEGGLKVGDLIVSFNGTKITDPTGLQLATAAVAPGTPVRIGILRNGTPMTLTVTLGLAPEDQTSANNTTSPNAPSGGVRLGIQLGDLTPDARSRYQIPDSVHGALIEGITPGGPAYNASIPIGPGEVITEVDRVPVANADEVRAQLAKLPPNQDVLLLVESGGPQAGGQFVVIHPAPAPGGGR